MEQLVAATTHRAPWNKGKLVGQKAPFKLGEIWAIRVRFQLYGRIRDLALFDLSIDSKLRACDLVRLRVRDVSHGDRVGARAIIIATEDPAPGAVRNHRANPPGGDGLGPPCRVSVR